MGIGEDFHIRPVWTRRGSARTLTLSVTDACRDRLAAFFHWRDRQSLAAAVAIAAHNRVSLGKVREWSRTEGHLDAYSSFITELGRARQAARAKTGTRRTGVNR